MRIRKIVAKRDEPFWQFLRYKKIAKKVRPSWQFEISDKSYNLYLEIRNLFLQYPSKILRRFCLLLFGNII